MIHTESDGLQLICASPDGFRVTPHLFPMVCFLTPLELENTEMKVLGDSKLTGKFQATIPRTVRNLLGLDLGDRVVFVLDDGRVLVRRGKLEVQV
jgi:AbrB family looped-hinge helix DNA binding protein